MALINMINKAQIHEFDKKVKLFYLLNHSFQIWCVIRMEGLQQMQKFSTRSQKLCLSRKKQGHHGV